MLYFIVRILVNAVALLLTLFLLPGLGIYLPATEYVVVFVIAIFIYGAIFAFLNWLLWPPLLVITGQFVVWTYGLFLVVINTLIFYAATSSIWEQSTDDTLRLMVVSPPIWLWVFLGGLLMTGLLFVLEGITGLDSPLQNWSNRRRPYWRVLGKLTFGGRNFLAENLRIAESLDTIQRYVREIIFANSPFAPIRRFFQRIIYWRRKPIVSTSTAQTVRYMLQDLGPTFVKLGQIVSSRAEQLPADWRAELAQLQSQVLPFPSAEAEAIVARELGQPISALYAEFDMEPLAAASTAQVHRAVLPSGQKVVVKIQRPDIDVTVRADLNVMRDLTRVTERRFEWARHTDLSGIMDEYADNILLELDYTNEAYNGRVLAENMRIFPNVHVPDIYGKLSTRRVMTQEFVKGVKITNVEAIDAAGLDRTELATTFMRAIVKQVLYDGFFHGDPHPGNVLVNLETGNIIFLDMGMMGVLSTEKRLAMADLIWSLAEGDGQEIGRVVLRLTVSYKEVDERAFIDDVERLLKRYTAYADVGVSISGAMKAMFDALNRAGLRMDADLTLALKALIQAEEITRTLDPSLPLVNTALDSTKQLLLETFDADRVVASLRRQAIRTAKEAIRNIPSIEDAALSWIQQFRSGKFTIYVDASDVGKQVKEVDATLTANIRRLTFALLLVGLLMGAAIASNSPSDILPNLPELAFFIFVGAATVTIIIVIREIYQWFARGDR